MLEGIQQSYPGVTGYTPQINPSQFNPTQFNPAQFNPAQINPAQINPTTSFGGPLGGVMASGVPGIFGNAGIPGNLLGRQFDPVTQAYLQQAQLAQQLVPQQLFGHQGMSPYGVPQWGSPIGGIGQFGRPMLDPITAAYIQQVQLAQQLHHSGQPGLLGNVFQGGIGQIGRPAVGLDPLTVACLQQAQLAQQNQLLQQAIFGRQPFHTQPFGVPQYGGLTPWY